MDRFLTRRAQDARFQNERRVVGFPSMTERWYNEQQPQATKVERFTFAAAKGEDNHQMTPHKDDGEKKSRKLKRKKGGGGEFTEAEKKRLRNRDSSDGSDSGGCWSGYESVEGVAKGKKGSCKKKGEKKE